MNIYPLEKINYAMQLHNQIKERYYYQVSNFQYDLFLMRLSFYERLSTSTKTTLLSLCFIALIIYINKKSVVSSYSEQEREREREREREKHRRELYHYTCYLVILRINVRHILRCLIESRIIVGLI